jgi:extradiol dioxygenase family protein
MVAEEYPEQIAVMPYGYSMNSLVLLHHWGETFNQSNWFKLVEKVCFHKLAFRINEKIMFNKDNYFNKILEEYGYI